MKIILLLELFAILSPVSHSEKDTASDTRVTLSSIETKQLQLIPLEQRNYFESMLKERAEMKNKLSSMATIFYEMQCFMPDVDFRCAMVRMKIKLADYFEMHVKAVSLGETRSICVDTHTQEIVKENDKCPKMIPKRDWQPYKGSDRNSTDQWYLYITEQDSSKIFHISRPDQKLLMDKLESYYNTLDDVIKANRGYTDLDAFKKRFASVITRCHRLACHYHHGIEKVMYTFVNARDMSLSKALLKVVPAWYFDLEHIEFLNIMQEVLSDSDRFYPVKYIQNKREQQVVIPGLPNCFKETVTPDFYPKLYSIVPEV